MAVKVLIPPPIPAGLRPSRTIAARLISCGATVQTTGQGRTPLTIPQPTFGFPAEASAWEPTRAGLIAGALLRLRVVTAFRPSAQRPRSVGAKLATGDHELRVALSTAGLSEAGVRSGPLARYLVFLE